MQPGGSGKDTAGASVLAFPARHALQVGFDRLELQRILDLYGRMVAAGGRRRHAAERPQARIEKRPALRQKQGMWTLFGEAGQVLKRGHELAGVLFPLERRLVKLVED